MAHILPQQAEGMTLYETSEKIVNELKSRGIFDTFRKDCLADVDTRPAYQNLRQRVENTVTGFLSKQKWTPELNRNQLRERLRKHLTESRFLEIGVDRIVDQVVDRNIYTTYMPQIRTLVNETLDVREEKQEQADDDVEMEDVAVPVADGNTFGTWANQFHARVPEPEPPCDRGESSMSISSASTDSQAAVAGGEESSCAAEAAPEPAAASDGCESPDIRAQMSPLSDDGKHTWGSFLGKADGLDFSGLMSNVGRMDPAIDEMIKSELGSVARESDPHRRDSPSRGANVSPQETDPAPPLPPPPPPEPRPPLDLHNFVGPSEAENQDGGAYRSGGRDHSGERRHRYSSGSRGDDRDGRGPHRSRDHTGGRHSPDDDRRRRDRDRERSRRMHGEHRSRGDSDRHRRDSDRDRGDDHEQQRDRGRHHQRRDRDDDGGGGGGHRAGSGRSVSASGYGHAFGGGSRGRESDRERGSSGQRHHGYHGNGRTAGGGDESPQDGVAVEVVVETELEVITTVAEERTDAASKDADTERKSADSAAKMSSSAHKKSSDKSSHSVGSKSSKDRRSSSDKKQPSLTKGSSTDKSSPAEIKSSHSSKHYRGSKFKSSNAKDNSSGSDRKPSHSTKSSRKSESSKSLHTKRLNATTGAEKADSSSINSMPEQDSETKMEPIASPEEATSPASDAKQASSRVPSSTSDASKPSSELKPALPPRLTPAPTATNTSDRMAQLMEKYAPHLKDRWHGTPKQPQYTYGGESARPPSPSQHATLRLLRQAEADLDTLSVSSVDTADLSDFDDCLELEVDVTQPEREELQRLGWRLVDTGEPLVAASPTPEASDPELIELSDTGDAESVDSGFNRSDASSLSAGSAEASRMVALTETEATGSAASSNASRPSSPSLSAPGSAEKRRRKRVDYVALNSGLDGESSVSAVAGRAERRRKRPGRPHADDGEWRPAARRPRWRGDSERLTSDGAEKKLECAQWALSGKKSVAGVTQLRDMGAAGDSVRIRPKLAI